MALSKIFKKPTVPEELPDLAIDELKKDSLEKEEKQDELKNFQEEKTGPEKEELNLQEELTEKELKDATEKEDKEESAEEGEVQKSQIEEKENYDEKATNLEKSFFNSVLNELKKDNFDPSKINRWYEKNFSEKGAIEEMKEYWEKKKDEFITETVEKEFKKRINERINYLQKLEAEWQEIYISLVKKEEEMKKEEKNIKKIIKDFSGILNKKGNLKKESKAK